MKIGHKRETMPFSAMIQSARNCFYYSDKHSCYLRLRLSEGRDIFLVVEAASPGAEIKGSQGKGAGDRTEYLAWQDSGEIQETVENLAISRPKDSGISTSFFDKQGVRIK